MGVLGGFLAGVFDKINLRNFSKNFQPNLTNRELSSEKPQKSVIRGV